MKLVSSVRNSSETNRTSTKFRVASVQNNLVFEPKKTQPNQSIFFHEMCQKLPSYFAKDNVGRDIRLSANLKRPQIG